MKLISVMIFSGTDYHSNADYDLRRVVVFVVVNTLKRWITFLCFDRFGSYLVVWQK